MYIVLKRVCLGGKIYYPGDKIDDSKEIKSGLKLLQNKGCVINSDRIDDLPNITAQAEDMEIDILCNGTTVLIPAEDIKKIFEILQCKAEDAKSAIEKCQSVPMLKLLSAIESRKTVKTAADSVLRSLTNNENEEV